MVIYNMPMILEMLGFIKAIPCTLQLETTPDNFGVFYQVLFLKLCVKSAWSHDTCRLRSRDGVADRIEPTGTGL